MSFNDDDNIIDTAADNADDDDDDGCVTVSRVLLSHLSRAWCRCRHSVWVRQFVSARRGSRHLLTHVNTWHTINQSTLALQHFIIALLFTIASSHFFLNFCLFIDFHKVLSSIRWLSAPQCDMCPYYLLYYKANFYWVCPSVQILWCCDTDSMVLSCLLLVCYHGYSEVWDETHCGSSQCNAKQTPSWGDSRPLAGGTADPSWVRLQTPSWGTADP